MKILECQLAIVQLAVGKNLVGQVLHQTLDAGRRRVLQGSRSGFNHVGQHDQSGFLGLGLGAGVPEVIDFHGIRAFQLDCLFIEIGD